MTVAINASAWNNAKERIDVVCALVIAVMGPPANATEINVSVQKVVVQWQDVAMVSNCLYSYHCIIIPLCNSKLYVWIVLHLWR